MTANLYEKNNKYHVMLSWYKNEKRIQKSIATGISVNGNNKRKAESARKSILDKWETKITDNHVDLLFSDFLKQWLDIHKHSIAETTYHSYKAAVERQISPFFEAMKIKLFDLKPSHIQDFYRKKLADGVSGNTVYHYHANINKALNYAVKTEYISKNPASKVELPKKEDFNADFYTPEEMRVLLEAIKGSTVEIPVYLAAWFGLRRGEVIGLRWQDIHFSSMRIYVRGAVTDKGSGSRTENLKRRDTTKTSSSVRSFSMPEEVAVYLMELKARQEESQKIAGNSYNTQWLDFVCVNALGDLIKPEYLSRTFPLFLEKHNLRKIRLHDLRCSNALLLLDNGATMREIQEWLGHANYSTTEKKYLRMRSDAQSQLSNMVSVGLSHK